MSVLREDEDKKELVNDKVKSFYSELLDTDIDYAESYIDWTLEKLSINKKHIKERHYKKSLKELYNNNDKDYKKIETIKKQLKLVKHNGPDFIHPGDVVHINFGVGLGVEFSKDHYGIVLSRSGEMTLIAPLSKTEQPYDDNNVIITGLNIPSKEFSEKAYVVFNQIRHIHYRRLEKIQGIKEGKINLNIEIVNEILTNFMAIIINNNNTIQKNVDNSQQNTI